MSDNAPTPPRPAFEFSDDELLRYFADKWKNTACEVCALSNTWGYDRPQMFNVIPISDGTKISVLTPTVQVYIRIFCRNCGKYEAIISGANTALVGYYKMNTPPRPTLVTEENADQFTGNSSTLVTAGGGPHDPGMETRVARLESDVGHIRSDIGEIKGALQRLAPRIDEMYGRQQSGATTMDISNLRIEIEKRPTRRQTVFDIFAIVGFVGVILTIAARAAH